MQPSKFIVENNIKHEHFSLINSTQDYAKSRVNQITDNIGFVFTADEQINGRGRGLKRWVSPPKVNFCGTFLLPFPLDKSALLFNLPQVTSYAVIKTLQTFGLSPTFKWINDVLINRHKIAGVLCESFFQKNCVVMIGIGLNVNMSQAICHSFEQPVTSMLVETGDVFDKEEILTVLQHKLITYLNVLIEQGFNFFKEELTHLLEFKDEWVKIQVDEHLIEGVLKGIDEQGRLLIKNQDSIEVLMNGHLIK